MMGEAISNPLDWLAAHPLIWQVGMAMLAVLLAAGMLIIPLSAGRLILLIVATVIGLVSLWSATHTRAPVEWWFLAFVVLLPATRFSLLELSFSLQANYVAMVVVALLLLWRAAKLSLPLFWPRSRVNWAILTFFVIICLSFFLSYQVPPGEYRGEVRYVRSAKQIAQLSLMLIAYAVVVLTVQDRRLFRGAVGAFIGSTMAVSLYGLYQFIAYPLGLPFMDLFPYSASFGPSRYWAIPLAGGRFLRIWSVASEPVWFGDFLAGAIPLILALLMGNVLSSRRTRLAGWVALAAATVALLLTFARSAYFAVIIGAAVVLLSSPRFLKRALVGVVVLVGILIIASLVLSQLPIVDQASLVQAVLERLISPFQEEYFGNIHRATAISASLDMFRDRPWGVGYGNYGFFFYDYKPAWGQSVTDFYPGVFPVMSGGMLLRLLTETSVPGLLAFLWLVVAVLRQGWRAARCWTEDQFMRMATLGLTAGFLALMLRLALDDSIHFAYQWFFIGMIVSSARLARRAGAEPLPDEVA